IAQWNKQKETIASESSALSYSHYKAAAQSPAIAETDAYMRSVPRRNGFGAKEAKNITDFMILKKAGLFDVKKMRIIQLMTAWWNANNKFDGRAMMANAEKLCRAINQQFGSRKRHMAARAALAKRVILDIMKQQVRQGCVISNDAKSCYDRIVHSVAFLIMAHMGMAYTVLLSMFLPLQYAKHFVRTAWGVSKQHYSSNREGTPFHGSGQGNGAGPAIWAVISFVLIRIMMQGQQTANFPSALSNTVLSLVCLAFVDDTYLFLTAPTHDTTHAEFLIFAQAALNHWAGLLRATGGALVPNKSFWTWIDFQWDGLHWQPLTQASMPGDVHVAQVDSTATEPLQRYDQGHSEITLGVSTAPDGNSKGVARQLMTKITAFLAPLRSAKLERNEVWIALTTRIGKSLGYVMPATTLNYTSWTTLMKRLLSATLPKAGMASNFPRAVIFGPLEHMGAGFMHPFYRQ
ncbi:MAG TPA: reverse transcriptase domain-containing protein, partial [Candidatus Obscuribacterales bacterium]